MGKRKEREAIILNDDHMKLAERLLSLTERGLLYEAVRRYAMEGVVMDARDQSETWQAVFEIMRSAQDKAIRNYEETCERNRRSAMKKRSRNSDDSDCCENSERFLHSQSNLIKSNLIESNQALAGTTASPKGEEVKGVPGVVWL